ncbi:hypothetical protein [Aquabacter cavernae]|uniref:hypothetical protein n=1 Tax=Aquabacter cavernae TaxID=2496029 RepID=UPI000F8D5EE1|nr:hypothetical protein [Aquabacter cavernae]
MKSGPLGPRFRFWRDQDGRRHVFSVYETDTAPDYSDALAVVARRTPAGPIALWAGPTGEPARKAAARFMAEEIHIHVMGEDAPDSLQALLAPPAPRAQPMPVQTAPANQMTARPVHSEALAARAGRRAA